MKNFWSIHVKKKFRRVLNKFQEINGESFTESCGKFNIILETVEEIFLKFVRKVRQIFITINCEICK